MSPLETINWAQVPFLSCRESQAVQKISGPIGIPDSHFFGGQFLSICGSLDKPQQLLQNTLPEHSFGCEQRKFISQVVSRLHAKHRQRAGARTLGDAHIYLSHIEPLKIQLQREPRPFPKLKIFRKVETIDDFKVEDFQIEGYNPHPAIKMEMAV
ncbi:Thymidylate synthase [Lemmus lemmus]